MLALLAAPVCEGVPLFSKREPPKEAVSVESAKEGADAPKGAPKMSWVLDDDARDRFMSLAARRVRIREELVVLTRILAEKRGESESVAQRAQTQFGIEDLTPFHRAFGWRKMNQSAQSAVDDPAVSVLSARFDQGHMAQIRKVVALHSLVSDETEAITLIVKEKSQELSKTETALRESFSVFPEKNYKYSPQTGVLEEVG